MIGDETETVLLRPRAFLPEVACLVLWRRSARARRVSLKISPRDAAVIVTLPMRAHRRLGMALLAEHAAWVTERLGAIEAPVVLEPGGRCPLAMCHMLLSMTLSAAGEGSSSRGGWWWVAGWNFCPAG